MEYNSIGLNIIKYKNKIMTENYKLLLNIVHWLDGKLD